MKLEPMTEAEASKVYKEWLNTPGSANEFDLIRMAVAVRDAQWQAAILADREKRAQTAQGWSHWEARIKQLMEGLGQPNSRSLYQAFSQLVNEMAQASKPVQAEAPSDDADPLTPEQEEWVMDLAEKHNLGRRMSGSTPRGLVPDVFYTDASYQTGELFSFAAELLATKQAEAPTASNERESCPHGNEFIVNDCLRCGAPVCCGRCCAEDPSNMAGEIAYQLTKRLVIDMPTARAAVDAALATQQEAQPQVDGPLSFNCTNGCGACGVKLRDFVTHATQAQDGDDWVTVASEPEIVSTCCGSPVEVWDERKQDIVGQVRAAQAEPAGGDKEDAERWRAARGEFCNTVWCAIGAGESGKGLDDFLDEAIAARAAQQATGERG